MTIAEYLETNRRNGEMPDSVASLARLLGVSRRSVYNWMRGTCAPKFGHILSLVQLSNGCIRRTHASKVIHLKTRNFFRIAVEGFEQGDDFFQLIWAYQENDDV